MTNHPSDDFDLGLGNPLPSQSLKDSFLDRALEEDRKIMAFDDIVKELDRATKKFGPMRSAHEGYAILKEEVDELWDDVKANAPVSQMRTEAVQVAAMAIRFIMDVCKPFPIRDLGPKPLPAMVEIAKPERRVTPCDKGAADRRGIVTVDLGPGTVSVGPMDEKGGFGKFKDYTKVDSFPVSFAERRVSPVADRRRGYSRAYTESGKLNRRTYPSDRRKVNAPRVERRFKVRRGVENYMSNLVGRRGSLTDRRTGLWEMGKPERRFAMGERRRIPYGRRELQDRRKA
jgi:hypothetical protein